MKCNIFGRYAYMPENYVTTQTEKGNICISEDVIQVMVTAAVTDIEGVAGFSNAIGADIADFLGIKNKVRGVKIASEDGKTVIDVLIMVRYGYGVTTVAQKVQNSVSANVEAMTGLKAEVNVHVTGISFEKTDMKG